MIMQEDPRDYRNHETTTKENVYPHFIPKSVKFYILLSFEIPSLVCYLFVIFYILTQKKLRSAPSNYALLILLFPGFLLAAIDIPLVLNFYQQDKVLFENFIFCKAWRFIDFPTWAMSNIIVSWASFERHILIFHDGLLRTKFGKIFLHYLPPILLLIYITCFHLYFLFFYPCQNIYNFREIFCGLPCYINHNSVSIYDLTIHILIPSILIVIFSVSLLIRVIRSKHRFQQCLKWKKYRRMVFQLIAISSLSLMILIPLFLINLLMLLNFYAYAYRLQELAMFMPYFYSLCLPFVYITSIPDVWRTLKTNVHYRFRRRIASMNSNV